MLKKATHVFSKFLPANSEMEEIISLLIVIHQSNEISQDILQWHLWENAIAFYESEYRKSSKIVILESFSLNNFKKFWIMFLLLLSPPPVVSFSGP